MRASLLLWACGGLLAAGATIAAEPVLRSSADGAVVVVSDGAGLVVDADGERRAAPLPRGVALEHVATVDGGWVVAGAAAEGRELLLLGPAGDGVVRLRGPASGLGPTSLKREAHPLVVDGLLGGLAWLEGETDDGLGVWAARWDGQRWGETTRVAPPGPGSQLALTAATLADGSQLLAWSAFDGRDDEIRWSLGDHRGWTAPARAHADNGVPDITPALVATADGALLAWSRYDGNDYRVVVARFADGTWSEPRTLGTAGTAFPRWLEVDGGSEPLLLFRRAVPASWVALEVGGDLRPLRRAVAPRRAAAVPITLPTGGIGLRDADGVVVGLADEPILR